MTALVGLILGPAALGALAGIVPYALQARAISREISRYRVAPEKLTPRARRRAEQALAWHQMTSVFP